MYSAVNIQHFRPLRSGWTSRVDGTVHRCAPFRLALGAGLRQGAPHSCGIVIDVIDGRAGLLPPGVIEPSVVDRVEPELVHQSHHDLFGTPVVARYW